MPGARTATRLLIAAFVGFACRAIGQDLEPRAYSAQPVGTNFVVAAVGRSSGDVVTDLSLPVTDVQATVNSSLIGAGRTFDLFGRTALVVATLPYAWGRVSGRIGEEAESISRSGLADARLKISVNLIGGRAVSARDFASVKRPTIVGASLSVVPPAGQYDSLRLVNLGSNRWAFKPEAGFSRLVGKWTLDGYAGVWLFTKNNNFYPGSSKRTQQPIVGVQAHTSYTMKPRLWIAFDATWYAGGLTIVDGATRGISQHNVRVGSTLSTPLSKHQSLKFGFGKGATTRIGSDFTTFSAAWQLTWLD